MTSECYAKSVAESTNAICYERPILYIRYSLLFITNSMCFLLIINVPIIIILIYRYQRGNVQIKLITRTNKIN